MDKALLEAKESIRNGEGWQSLLLAEKQQTNSAPTGDDEFDRLGYKVIRNVCDVELLTGENNIYTTPPKTRAQYNYEGNINEYSVHTEAQVPGSTARYYYPPYNKVHQLIKKRIEESIGSELYKTYYYDRFYYPGHDLKIHLDRPACEISITVQIGTNLKDKFPIYIKGVDGNVSGVDLEPGDGMIYKGCERPHWRLSMPGVKRNKIRKLFGMKELYYHQVFFHYVLANGHRSHFADDIRHQVPIVVGVQDSI